MCCVMCAVCVVCVLCVCCVCYVCDVCIVFVVCIVCVVCECVLCVCVLCELCVCAVCVCVCVCVRGGNRTILSVLQPYRPVSAPRATFSWSYVCLPKCGQHGCDLPSRLPVRVDFCCYE